MKRQPKNLSHSLENKLNAYALAASAAGVGLLALAVRAEAKIVYTKVHHVFDKDGIYHLSLRNNSQPDFLILDIKNSRLECVDEGKSENNDIATNMLDSIYGNPFSAALALRKGTRIPSAFQYFKNPRRMPVMFTTFTRAGLWFNVRNRYLGLKFSIRGTTHYGWARMSVHDGGGIKRKMTGILTGYAYETIPNKPIIAGKTNGSDDPTLGRLAQGASGVPAWRQKQ